MRVTKEQKEAFKKLKQNDRIELLLRTQRLEDSFPEPYIGLSLVSSLIYMFLFIIGFLFLAATQFRVGSDLYISFFSLIRNIIRPFTLILTAAIGMVIADYLILIIRIFDYRKEKKELLNEFFDTTVTPRSKIK
jgi:hypothetical protein